MQERPWLSDDQLRAWVHYLGAHTLVQRALERHLHEAAGISHAEYEILTRLDGAPGRRMRMGELAAVLFSPGSRLNYRITRLAGLGWVRREQHPTDRRGLYAVLTDEGADFLRGVTPGYRQAVRRHVVAPLTDEEFAELGRLSRKLFQHHLARGD
ncbi:MarR family winged helix-turn-helix transcriptional regulator [Amycolatopsis thermophila]|uniref:DNA-binding MarR family transcriptional regulator n=1 Tax=Amycolatopsis thermophila TaxID=206084 RepID=A0ABU0EV84_9PSEU|nr:MarR family transcriptional regulator [Amycolatopsis thermophila]MDQ0379013.1 DNA-binding MarR family transcriptional regulator [Amycolatopsis thermophila]